MVETVSPSSVQVERRSEHLGERALHAQGQFNEPRGVTVDDDGNILVVERGNHRIQKFRADGKFLTAVGQRGNKHLEFSEPIGVTINHRNQKVYFCDRRNHRIQILNADLTFSSSFGRCGRGDG